MEGREYRIYVLRDGQPQLLGETSKDGVGTALVTLFNDGEWNDDDRVGILFREHEDETGIWIVNPFGVGR